MVPSELEQITFIASEITFLYKTAGKKTFYNVRVDVKKDYLEITKLGIRMHMCAIVYKEDIASFTYILKY